MPEEVRAAKRINSEGERIIDKAQEEAERILARARREGVVSIPPLESADPRSGVGKDIVTVFTADVRFIKST